jgi:hypothetical protein
MHMRRETPNQRLSLIPTQWSIVRRANLLLDEVIHSLENPEPREVEEVCG